MITKNPLASATLEVTQTCLTNASLNPSPWLCSDGGVMSVDIATYNVTVTYLLSFRQVEDQKHTCDSNEYRSV